MARFKLQGTAVAPGVGIGTVFVIVEAGSKRIPQRKLRAALIEPAMSLFEQARQRAIAGLERIQEATAAQLGDQDAAIYGAQIAVLKDPAALEDIERMVRHEHLAPASAIQALLDKFTGLFEKLEGGDIKNWAADLRDPWYAVIRELSEEGQREIRSEGHQRYVVVAEELTPSLVTRFQPSRLAGLVCERGGRFSHGAVLARSFGIPTVVGVERACVRAQDGMYGVVDGDRAEVLLGASKKERSDADTLVREQERVAHVLQRAAAEPGRTADGVPIAIHVNIESPRDLELFDPSTCAGVGLFRTEFAYMERPNFPGAEEQLELYRSILQHFPGKPVVFRTLDVGGDKPLRYFKTPKEHNPSLGWRGLRVSLEWKDLFLVQLEALSRAREIGDSRILLPMVTTLEELRKTRELIGQLHQLMEGEALSCPVGIMVEVPAAAMALKDLAFEADFISVGTNDLAQYLFAVDRDNPWVSDLYQPYHPAHLRVLRYIATTCNLQKKPLSVCGEMAGDLPGALFLVGAGYRNLSMAPPFAPRVKAVLREARLADLECLARDAAASQTSDEARNMLQEAADSYWKGIVSGVMDNPPPNSVRH